MQLDSHVHAIQQELGATAALGDEAAAEAARRMGEALAATLHLHLLDLLGEAALEITGQIESGRVEVRLAGRDPELVVVSEDAGASEPLGLGEEASGRITLRLPESGTHPLPPGLGEFPLRRVEDFPGTVPPRWLARGGVMLRVYLREALWLSFAGSW